MRKKGGSHLPRDKGGRHVPAYPGKIESGSNTPEGYQREHRSHKPSPHGVKTGVPKRGA